MTTLTNGPKLKHMRQKSSNDLPNGQSFRADTASASFFLMYL